MWGPPPRLSSYSVIQIYIFRNYAKRMKMKLAHLLCGCLILILNIDIFFPAHVGQPEWQFNFKVGGRGKVRQGCRKIIREWNQNVAFWEILQSKKWKGGGTNALPRTDATGVILSITVVNLYASLEANSIYVKDKLVSNIWGMREGTKPHDPSE